MEFPPHHALFRLKPIPIEGYPLHDRASSPLFQGRFAGVLLMKSLRSDDEKSGSSERRCCLSPLPTHSWASLITPPVGLARGPSVRSTERPTGGPATQQRRCRRVISPSWPNLAFPLPIRTLRPPSLPPLPSVRPSVTKPDGPWPASSSRPRDRRTEWMEDEKEEEKEDGAISATGGQGTAEGALDATLLITKLPTLANMGNVAVVSKAGVTGGGRGRAGGIIASLPPPSTKRRRH